MAPGRNARGPFEALGRQTARFAQALVWIAATPPWADRLAQRWLWGIRIAMVAGIVAIVVG